MSSPSPLSPETLILIAGALLSLLFAYAPGVKPWFEKQPPIRKRLVMLGLLALAALGVFAYACAGRTALVACDAKGGWTLLEFFILAVVANQSAFLITPKRTS